MHTRLRRRAGGTFRQAQIRAGHVVAEDEGVRESDSSQSVARDVGIDGGAASAEEAAVHEADEP